MFTFAPGDARLAVRDGQKNGCSRRRGLHFWGNLMAIKKHNISGWLIRHLTLAAIVAASAVAVQAQINTDRVMAIGRNALYFEDYILSIQYFNQVIKVKPYLAEPYFYRAVAKLELEDYKGAEEDCSLAIERNPFIIDAYQVRGIARQTMHMTAEAVDDYNVGLNYMPEHKSFLMNKAVCEEALERYDSAEVTYGTLLRFHPKYEYGYMGRAQLRLAQGDTLSALDDLNHGLELNKNISSAYVIRSEINMKFNNDMQAALADMDEAIKLEPQFAGYFINRAYMKYNLDDYFGAMSDYDYAVSLDPANVVAHFNRGLLLTEVSEDNKAIEDFSYVLRSEPDNFIARYNRALLYQKTGQYREAIADFDIVLERYPDFELGLYQRSECKRKTGDLAGGEQDYNRSRELNKKKQRFAEYNPDEDAESITAEVESESAVMNKFHTLLTVETDNGIKPKYESKTRGRIQDNNFKIDPEPMFFMTYYAVSGELRDNTYYMREVTDLNAMRLLSYTVVLSNNSARLYEDQIQRHFNSIEYYNGMLATSAARSIDFFARAMDFMMLRNPAEAIADFTRAIEASPTFTLAYFGRAYARVMQMQIEQADEGDDATSPLASHDTATGSAMLKGRKHNAQIAEIIADFDKTLELSPNNIYALFNKGNVYMTSQDYTSAISCYTSAIENKLDFGEAYYNRGLVYLRLGNREKGIADLSKAGELGILPSYNVLKRMSR